MAGAEDRAAQRRSAVSEAAQIVRTLYLSFLFFGGYLAVTVAGTGDVAFLKDTPVHLPVLGVDMPTVAFFTLAPWAFVLVHMNFLFNVYLLWCKLDIFQAAVAELPPAAARAERLQIFPLIFCQAAVSQPYPRSIRVLIDAAVLATTAVLPFALVLFSALRFHSYPDPALVDIPRLAVLADLLVVGFFGARIAAVRGEVFQANWWLRGWRGLRARAAWSRRGRFLIRWLRLGRRLEPPRAAAVNLGAPAMAATALYVLAEAMIGMPSLSLDLRKTVLVDSATPKAAVREARDALTVPPPGLDKVVGLDLSNSVLARAAFDEAFMPKARLRRSDLRRAELREAGLVEADLTQANLRGANLKKASLYRARLRGADLRRVGLHAADLRRARLGEADLRGANLKGAILTGARLRKADLRGANLAYAKLTNADLTRARLAGADLGFACGSGAGLPEGMNLPDCSKIRGRRRRIYGSM